MSKKNYNAIAFKNRDIDRINPNSASQDSIPKPTYGRFNRPLFTGPNMGTSKDSSKYEEGYWHGVKKTMLGRPSAISTKEVFNSWYSAGSKDGVQAVRRAWNLPDTLPNGSSRPSWLKDNK